MHLDTIPFILIQRDVVTTLLIDGAREDEMFVEVVNKLEDVAFHAPCDADVIDQTNKL
mgnify:CR=1 FL=1